MNKLRRAIEKKRVSEAAEKKPPRPAEKLKKEDDKPKEKAPGQNEFKRTLDVFWSQAILELSSSLAKTDTGETWE